MEDLELKKLDLARPSTKEPKKTDPTVPMPRRKRKVLSKKNTKIIAIVAVVLVLLFGFVGIKAWAAVGDAKRTYVQAKVAVAKVKEQNVVAAKDELVKTKTDLESLKKDVDSLGLFGYIPVLGWYIRDAQHGINASLAGVDAAITATDSLIPYADVLGLKGGSSFTAGSAQDRIRLAVQTLDKVVPKIDDIEKNLVVAQEEIDKVNEHHYPNFWKFKMVRDRILQVKSLADDGVTTVEQGKPLIKVLPQLMGADETKKYLILFQNDKELRPTGGFITYYAIFKIDQGNISVEKSSNIYDLDDSIPTHPAAPSVLQNYLEVNRWYIRDTNLSPDFMQSMKDFNALYKKSSEYQDVDGIIAIDTHFLVDVINILGEVQAAGLTFNATTDPHCDCPQVVYELENQITRPVNYIKSNRKALIGELLYGVMQKALQSSPKEYWGRLVQAGVEDAQEKHVLMYLYNSDAQKGIEALGWGGRVRESDGDYLYINDANLGGNKANLYIGESVRLDYNVTGDKISRTVEISYKNPKPHSDCNLEHGGLCLNAPTRTWQRVYVPLGSKLTKVTGSEIKATSYKDLGKTAFEGFTRVNPLGASRISYTYDLPMKADSNTIDLLIQKQPGIDTVPYEIYVNGKLKEMFDLKTDKTVTVKIK